jgi:hypothetical protein
MPFFVLFVSNQRKKLFNMAFLTFRVRDIFYMLFEKSYDTVLRFLVETFWKYIENFPHFWFKKFQTNFSGILS